MATRIPIIDTTRCSGCGRCIAACPLDLFAFEQEGWRKISVLQSSDRCNGCAQCAVKCPLNVIAMEKQTAGWAWIVNPRIRPVHLKLLDFSQ